MTAKRTTVAAVAFMLLIAMCVSLTACSAGMTMEAFIKTADGQLDSMRESMGDATDIRLEARGNSMVYVFQYKEDLGVDNAALAETLNSSLEAMSSTFTSVLSQLKTAVPSAESVIVEYQDASGNVITSREFK